MKIIAKNIFSRTGRGTVLLPVVVLGFLWFVLINHLRVEWTLNPQYSYGWAVPFLCLYLVWQKIQTPEIRSQTPRVCALIFIFCVLAFLYAPTRLVEEANPDWRLISWALAVEVIGITLCILRFGFSAFRLPLSAFIFPLCFFLVAVPWPTFVEHSLIQELTRADAGATCELLGWLGIPALPHGNVIEVATGEVGIDEACSGIRSFQATLMISLFLGEFYRLNILRRVILIFGGFALSFLFNLARMSLLVWVAARKGIAAISTWHDPAGVTILVACFFGLLGLGEWFNKKQKAENRNGNAETPKTEILKEKSPATNNFSISAFQLSVFILFLWILAVEISVECWYRSHEARVPRAAQWTVSFPSDNPTLKQSSIAESAREILRYDEGRSASWLDNDIAWQMIFLRWNPGQTAQHLAQNHTPEICLTAAGHTLVSIPGQQWLDVRGLRLPFLAYEITDAPRPLFVFYCLWDDRASEQGFQTASLTWGSRLAPVLAGLRNPGQRSLEIAVAGADDFNAAETAVRAELVKLIVVKPE